MTQRPKLFAISEQQRMVLQEFIGTLNLPWKQTNPFMQILGSLPEVEVAPATPAALKELPETPKNE